MAKNELRQRASLARALQDHLSALEGTQAVKAKSLGITQPRLNDLLKNRLEKFSLDALVELTKKAGLELQVKAQKTPLLGPKLTRTNRLRPTSPLLIPAEELGRLTSIDAPLLFLRLLWCMALSSGLNPTDVVLSGNTTTPDGGIDAKVVGAPKRKGLLAKGESHFQIKTGTGFKPWQKSHLVEELFGSGRTKPSKKSLAPAVRECLEKGGSYCLVTFGHDLLPHQHTTAETLLRQLLTACGYASAKIQVIGQGQLAGEIQLFPSICYDLLGFDDDNFLTMREWRRQQSMQLPLSLGEKQSSFVSELRELWFSHGVSHIRIVGEPGIGKTRLVLEALSAEQISPTVVYARTGEDLQKSKFLTSILRRDDETFVTIVVDDCADKDRSSIWGALRGKPNIRLITIDHGQADGTDSGMRVLECPPLLEPQILDILHSYTGGNRHDLRVWAELCEGSPRVAHAVGENLKHNPKDILRPPSDVPLWDRFIVGFAPTSAQESEERRLVLRYVSLFTRFGFEHPVSEEGRFISDLIREADPSITYQRFQAIVQHFRDRRVLQGRHTLFLVPKALHVYLWLDFWDKHGRGFNFQEFYERLPESLRDWFLRLFTYAHGPAQALAVVRSITAPTGPYKDASFVSSSVGPRLLRYLSEADPISTLACIERTYGTFTPAELKAWHDGRQDIVWALERIAVWDSCFDRAARVLIRMALAENESYSNNSKGTLCDLFKIGIGWAATEASPTKRFPLLEGLLTSDDDADHALGLELAKSWLDTHGGSRIVGVENQGLRPTITFWSPKTYGEVFDAWRQVWKLLQKQIREAPKRRKDSLAQVITSAAQDLIYFAALNAEVLDSLFELARVEDISRKPLIGLVIDLLKNRHDKLPPEVIKRLESLDELLTGTSLWDRIARHVIHSNWSEDFEVIDGKHQRTSGAQSQVQLIAKELMTASEPFAGLTLRLLESSGYRLPGLGYECGLLSSDESLDLHLLAKAESGGPSIGPEFLGGYLGGVKVGNSDRWESAVLRLLKNPSRQELALGCIWRSGVSERVLSEFVHMIRTRVLAVDALNRFALNLREQNISESSLNSLLDAILDSGDGKSGLLAAELIYDYYIAGEVKRPLPRDRPLKSLLLAAETIGGKDHMSDFNWGRLAKAYIAKYPKDSISILESVVTSTMPSPYGNSEATKVLLDIIQAQPLEAWKVIAKRLESESARTSRIDTWVSGDTFMTSREARSNGPVSYFPVEEVIKWIKEDRKTRTWRVLGLLPKTLDSNEGGLLTSRFIEEFCSDEDFQGALAGHFWGGGWTGPESEYLEKKRDRARKWLSDSQSPSVQSWLNKYIDSLAADIETAKIREEREF